MLYKVLPKLIEKGIPTRSLLESNVFRYSFESEQWPVNHYNDEDHIRPYNDNIFLLHKKY